MTNPFLWHLKGKGEEHVLLTDTEFPDLVGIYYTREGPVEWSGVDHLWNAGVCSVESRSQSGEHTL